MHRFVVGVAICLGLVTACARGGDSTPSDATVVSDCALAGHLHVTSTTPARNATRVIDDPVVIEFDESVDPATFAAALPSATNVAWTNSNSQVTFTYPFQFSETPQPTTLTIPTIVRAADGCSALGEDFVMAFTLDSVKSVELDYVSGMSGNNDEDGSSGTFVLAGDAAANDRQFAGLTFDMSGLPPITSITKLRNAFLRAEVSRLQGNPADPALGGFFVESVSFGSRAEVVTAAPKGLLVKVFATGVAIPLGAPIEVDVRDLMATEWLGAATQLQFRIYPSNASANSIADIIYIRRSKGAENAAVVDPSLPISDPSNNVRIDLEYFE